MTMDLRSALQDSMLVYVGLIVLSTRLVSFIGMQTPLRWSSSLTCSS